MGINVTVLGWYNHGNTGDDAYQLAFPRIFPELNLIFVDNLSGNIKSDAIFLGGGDVLQKDFLNQLEKTKVPKYAMSVNLKSNNISTYIDIFKQLFVRNICTTSDKILSIPDFAFALEPNPENGRKIIKNLFQGADLYEKVVVIVMNAYLCSNESALARDHITFDKVCFDLAKIMDTTSASFLLLPFGNGFPFNDRIAASALYSKCKYWRKNVLLYRNLSVQGTLDVISAANMLIGTRLHASIFACISGTPFIDLTHHDKTTLFLESINKDWGISYWNFNVERLKSFMTDFLVNDRHRVELLQIAKKNREFLLTLPNYLKL